MLRATSRAKKVQGKLTHVFPSVSRSNKLARASRRKEVPCCANQQPPFHRNPVVFRPASQTCPPGYFDPVDKYENPYKKELPVGHWNSQYLEDPDAWWGDAGKSDDGSIGGRSGGSGGGLGSGSGGGWEFEDDDEYDEAALGLLVLCLGAISSGIASGCIVYEASFLATDVFTSTRGSPATRSLPPSKRMLWFRKHGNARLVLGFPISAWVCFTLLCTCLHELPSIVPCFSTQNREYTTASPPSVCDRIWLAPDVNYSENDTQCG